MTLTSEPSSPLPQSPLPDGYWSQVLSEGRVWASEHRPLLGLIFAEFARTSSWPKQDVLKRELARTGQDFRVLDDLEGMPRLLGWVDRSSGEIVLKPLALSVVAEALALMDYFISALRLAVESYLGSEPSPKLTSEQLQIALQLDEKELRKLGKVLLNEHLWLGSTTDPSGTFVEALVSDRILEFAQVSGVDDYLDTSTRISYPRPPGVPTGLPTRFTDDLAAFSAQTPSETEVHPSPAWLDLALYPDIVSSVTRHLEAGLNAEAVLAAYGVLRDLVRERSGLHAMDGHDLYGKALSPDNPLIVLADLTSKTGKDYQRSVMLFCQGVAGAIRNPLTHAKHDLTDEEAREMLATMSLLYRKICITQSDGRNTTT